MNTIFIISVLFYAVNGLKSKTNCKVNKVANSDRENAECWINSDLIQLHCEPAWNAVHLEVIHADISTTKVGLNPSIFSQCTQLHVLAIWENSHLTWLQRDVFQALGSLGRLVVRSKKLATIDWHLLAFLPELQYLSVTDSNHLSQLDRKIFEPCPESLTTLDLSNNQISGVLQSEIFVACSLINLYLNGNRISSLAPGSLAGLSNLRFLRLDKNVLAGSLEKAFGFDHQEGSQSALASTPNLEVLDLSGNQLSEIKSSSWSSGALLKLRILNLANNQLQWLDPEAFKELSGLSELRLEGNSHLLQLDGIGSLALVLFGFSKESYPYMKHLIIPGKSLEMDVCNHEQVSSSFKIIDSVVSVLKKSICNQQVSNVGATLLISEEQREVEIEEPSVELEAIKDEGPILNFIRTTHRWVLACIVIGLLLSGVLISSLVFCCLIFVLRSSDNQEDNSTTVKQISQQESYRALNTSRTSIETPHIYSPDTTFSNKKLYTPLVRPQQFPGSIQQRQQRYNQARSPPLTASARRIKYGSQHALSNVSSHSLYSLLSGPSARPGSMNALNLRPINTARQVYV